MGLGAVNAAPCVHGRRSARGAVNKRPQAAARANHRTSPPPPPPRAPGAQGGSLDGRGWIRAPGAGWGAHYCQLTALTGPRGVLCVHLGVPV